MKPTNTLNYTSNLETMTENSKTNDTESNDNQSNDNEQNSIYTAYDRIAEKLRNIWTEFAEKRNDLRETLKGNLKRFNDNPIVVGTPEEKANSVFDYLKYLLVQARDTILILALIFIFDRIVYYTVRFAVRMATRAAKRATTNFVKRNWLSLLLGGLIVTVIASVYSRYTASDGADDDDDPNAEEAEPSDEEDSEPVATTDETAEEATIEEPSVDASSPSTAVADGGLTEDDVKHRVHGNHIEKIQVTDDHANIKLITAWNRDDPCLITPEEARSLAAQLDDSDPDEYGSIWNSYTQPARTLRRAATLCEKEHPEMEEADE